MSGEHDLKRLLAGMSPVLDTQTYVFVTLPERTLPQGPSPLMVMQEDEGTTIIITRDDARKYDIAYEFSCRRITLNVHSALEAVGFLAAVATRLAGLGMGVNPVAGFYHDHLFVPQSRAGEAMLALRDMATEARAT